MCTKLVQAVILVFVGILIGSIVVVVAQTQSVILSDGESVLVECMCAQSPLPTATNMPTDTPTPINTDTPMPTSTETPTPTGTPLPTATPIPGAGIVVNHTNADADVIPLEYLDAVREMKVLFMHASIGYDIWQGMVALEGQNWTRYHIVHADRPTYTWLDTNSGIDHQGAGEKFYPNLKLSRLDDLVRNEGYANRADVIAFKFCVVDFVDWWMGEGTAETAWPQYRDTLEALESDYPDVEFVWFTVPLRHELDEDDDTNEEKTQFNTWVRAYATDHDKILFDVADIESHDLSGNSHYASNEHEAGWEGWYRDGTHLNGEVGRPHFGGAFWVLLARIAGWSP